MAHPHSIGRPLILLITWATLLARIAIAEPADPPLQGLPERPIELPVMACEALTSRSFAPVQQVTFRIASASIQPRQAGRMELCLVKGYVAPQVQFALYLPAKAFTGRYL